MTSSYSYLMAPQWVDGDGEGVGNHLAVLSHCPHQDAGHGGHFGGGWQREGGDGGGREVTDGFTATVHNDAFRHDLHGR